MLCLAKLMHKINTCMEQFDNNIPPCEVIVLTSVVTLHEACGTYFNHALFLHDLFNLSIWNLMNVGFTMSELRCLPTKCSDFVCCVCNASEISNGFSI